MSRPLAPRRRGRGSRSAGRGRTSPRSAPAPRPPPAPIATRSRPPRRRRAARPRATPATHTTRARSRGIHAGAPAVRLRHHARAVPRAGTTMRTSWPRAASRSACVRIARTPPAIRTCGQRNVILTRDRSTARGGVIPAMCRAADRLRSARAIPFVQSQHLPARRAACSAGSGGRVPPARALA